MKRLNYLVMTLSSICSLQIAYAEEIVAPLGFWKTIDDVTGQPKAIIQITEAKDKSLYGRVLKIYPRPGYDQNQLCVACKGQKHNQPIVGMQILENLKQNKENTSLWSGGNILDPKNGKTYNCQLQVAENGNKLNVRGYVGVPLFGRTQSWLRITTLEKA